MAAIALSFIYFIGAVYIASSNLGDLAAFHVVYRVVYMPLAFWAFTFAYAYFFRKATKAGKMSVPLVLLLGLPSHILLLLGNVYFSIALKSPQITTLYKFYIEVVLYAAAALAIVWGMKMARKDRFFLPLALVGLYPIYLSIQHGTMRPAVVVMLALSAYGIRFAAKIKDILKSKWRAALVIFTLAFLIRLVFGIGIIQKTQDRFPLASDDGQRYDMHGYNIARDISYLRNPDFTPTAYDTGYSLFLALVYRVFGRSFYIVVILQSLIGAIVPVMVYLLGMRIMDDPGAILAAFWASLDQPLIMFSCVLGQEALYIPILTSVVFLITKYALGQGNKISLFYDISIGALLGAANVIRTVILYFVPIISGYMLFVKSAKTLLKKTADVILILTIMFAIIAPLTYLNFLNSGKFFLLTEPKPIMDWLHDGGQAGGYFPTNKALAEMGIDPFMDPVGSLAALVKHPLKFLSIEASLLPRRIIALFSCHTFGFFDPIYMVNAARLPNAFASNMEFYTSAMIIIGFFLIVKRRQRRKEAYPMLLVIFYYTMVHVVLFRMGNIRYRAPIHPYLIIFGALGIRSMIDYIRKGLSYSR